MLNKTRSTNLLDLKESEEIILQILSETPKSVATIARISKLPRMTSFEALKSLKRRGIVERTLIGKRRLWSKIETHRATELLQMTLNTLIGHNCGKSEKLFIQLYENLDEIFEVLKNSFEKNSTERLIGIQSTTSARACINALGIKKTMELNEIIKKNKIIIEGLLEGDFLEFKKEFGNDWAKSYIGRSAAVTFIPKKIITISEDIHVFKKSLFIINWNEKRALEIIHPEIVLTFQKIIYALAKLGRKVDINALVREA